MADGRSFPVRHPEFVHILSKSARVIVEEENGDYDILPGLLISEVRAMK